MVETFIRRGGQLCCSSVANLLQYLRAKNYQNKTWFADMFSQHVTYKETDRYLVTAQSALCIALKVNVKEGHTPNERGRAAHLPFIGR